MMEIFQAVLTALTTQNEIALAIVGFLSCFIDAFVNMLLFTTILNIETTKKSKILYVIIFSIVGFLIRALVPVPYATFCNIGLCILFIKFILKTTWLKSLLGEFILLTFSSILELLWFNFFQSVLKISQDQLLNTPALRLVSSLSIYLCVYLIYKLIRYCKFHISIENMNKKNKILFIVNALLGILAIGVQFYLMGFYSDKMPIGITIISIISLIGYFFISIYNILNTTKLATTSQNLEEAQLDRKSVV